jgi:hypothetical protein
MGELEYYERAVDVLPDLVELQVEAIIAALDIDVHRAGRMLDRVSSDDPRIRLLRIRHALLTGDPRTARDLLADGMQLPSVREGDNPLADLWRETEEALGTNRPVPAQYQFGMGGN